MIKKTLQLSALSLGLFASTAYAHVEMPVAGTPINFIEGSLTWNGTNTLATGTGETGHNNFVAFDFSVFTAGTLDIFGNDRQSFDAANTSIYIFKHDETTHAWNNYAYSFNGDNNNFTNPKSAVNTYGVPVTGWFDVNTPGDPEAGLTEHFATGDYMAVLVSSQILPLAILALTEEPVGYVQFAFDEGWVDDYTGEHLSYGLAPYDLTVRVAADSSAVIGATPSQVPVPGAVWLMGSALAGFGVFGRKKAAIVA